MTLETWASAPSGSPPRPSLRPSAAFSSPESTSKLTLTAVTPSRLADGLGHAGLEVAADGAAGVVSETITSTTPLG